MFVLFKTASGEDRVEKRSNIARVIKSPGTNKTTVYFSRRSQPPIAVSGSVVEFYEKHLNNKKK